MVNHEPAWEGMNVQEAGVSPDGGTIMGTATAPHAGDATQQTVDGCWKDIIEASLS